MLVEYAPALLEASIGPSDIYVSQLHTASRIGPSMLLPCSTKQVQAEDKNIRI